MIAMNIFTVFNMFNDPIIGYLCDRSTKLTSKWGKRFPFIVMGAFPWAITILFIFIPPSVSQVGQLGVFFWVLIMHALMDTAFALYNINRGGLFPDKFRHQEDRNWAGFIGVILETFGVILGFIIPILAIMELGETNGFVATGIIVSIASIILFILMIPGVREGPDIRARRSALDEKEIISFFSGMKEILKNKIFIGFQFFSIAYGTAMGIIMTSIPYFVEDVLHMGTEGQLIVIFYVIGVILMAPIWYKLSFKIGIKRVGLIGGLCLGFMGLPILFIPTGNIGLLTAIIVLSLAGAVDGAIISMMGPLSSAMIDDASIKSRKRQEGLYGSVGIFLGTISTAIRYTLTWFIWLLFGYQRGATDSTALLGLRIQIAIFPMIIILTGVLIFWKLYSLSRAEIKENIIKLKEMGI
jgi:GPH family glycoside/pentoside/hexuronide:cation symporter